MYNVDLSNCDREPVQRIGAIQPHGALLVLDAATLTIQQASDNLESFFGKSAAELCGQPLTSILSETDISDLKEFISSDDRRVLIPLEIQGFENGTALNGIFHRTDGVLLLELEPADGGAPDVSVTLSSLVVDTLERIEGETEVLGAMHALVNSIRLLTGYDRVMAYRFDEEWNGEVIVDERLPEMPSWLGLRYPSSDIPAPARDLFSKNWIRLIPTIDYEPSRVIPEMNFKTRETLDLTYSILRAVSPIHLEYLRNMEVGASLTISLRCKGRLWGLIACHHRTPRYVNFWVRAVCELLAKTFSIKLSVFEAAEHEAKATELRRIFQVLAEGTASGVSYDQVLTEDSNFVLSLTGADGFAVVSNDDVICLGRCLPTVAIRGLIPWMEGHGNAGAKRSISEAFPELENYKNDVSGALFAKVRRGSATEWLMWFRGEQVEDVAWGGNPHKNVRMEDDGKLHPRKSFGIWKETVRGKCLAWTPLDLDGAEKLATLVEASFKLADLRKTAEQVITSAEHDYEDELKTQLSNSLRLEISKLREMGYGKFRDEKGTLSPLIEEHQRILAQLKTIQTRPTG